MPDAPVKYSNAMLRGSQFVAVNLADVSIEDANIAGMKINGVLVIELFRAYATLAKGTGSTP